MFARGFFRTRVVRRMISVVAALLAFAAGVLVLISALAHGLVAGILAILLGLGTLIGALTIYRGGRALVFARARLSFAGFLTIAAGVILYFLGFGLEGLLAIAAGILSWVATVF